LKLLIFSDIHNDLRTLERHMETEADYYFAAGDLVNWARGLDACGEILKRRAERVYVMPGNHESEDQIGAFCREFGFANFHSRHFETGGYHIAGLGYSNPTPFGTPGEYSEAELARRLEPFGGMDPLILICHCPPRGSALDQIRTGLHAGSRSVGDFIERHQPLYFFCGHIHEAAGVSVKMGRTTAINVGKQGYLLELG
jgi:hypothetical protein